MRNHLESQGGSINLHDLMQFPPEGIFTRILVKSESFSCALICLGAGHEIDKHTLSGNACLQILSGSGELVTSDGVVPLQSGKFQFLAEHTEHSIVAKQDLAFLFCLSHLIPRDLYILKRRQSQHAA
jgi:quercetin dioxygenase-like cupin family protein